VRCYRMPVGCLASTRRSQGDGGLRNDCLRLFALTRIHDVVRCSIVRTFLAPQDYCDVPRDYSAARETHSDCLGFAAGFWLSIGTSND
jgi:hypothetical protein